MDDKTTEQLDVFLKLVNESLQSGKDFVLEQAPLVVQEMVTFGRIYNSVMVFAGVALVLSSCFAFRGAWKAVNSKSETYFDCYGEKAFFIGLSGAILAFAGFSIVGCHLQGFVQAFFAPRLYVLEQVASMLK